MVITLHNAIERLWKCHVRHGEAVISALGNQEAVQYCLKACRKAFLDSGSRTQMIEVVVERVIEVGYRDAVIAAANELQPGRDGHSWTKKLSTAVSVLLFVIFFTSTQTYASQPDGWASSYQVTPPAASGLAPTTITYDDGAGVYVSPADGSGFSWWMDTGTSYADLKYGNRGTSTELYEIYNGGIYLADGAPNWSSGSWHGTSLIDPGDPNHAAWMDGDGSDFQSPPFPVGAVAAPEPASLLFLSTSLLWVLLGSKRTGSRGALSSQSASSSSR